MEDDSGNADAGDDVLGLSWPEFLPWFQERWRPGEHVNIVARTGTGKTTIEVGILPLRRWVLALDAKGGDRTLSALEKRGFRRLSAWPPDRRTMRSIRDRVEAGQPARFVVGKKSRKRADRPGIRETCRAALLDAQEWGGWTICVDELQLMTDPRMMDLDDIFDELAILARDAGVSLVSAAQQVVRVSRAASNQATWFIAGYTRDLDAVARLGEMAGRSRAEMRGAVRALRNLRHSILVFSDNPYDPVVTTIAPRVV